MKRIIIITTYLLIFLNLNSQNNIKCPWGLKWGMSKNEIQETLVRKNSNYIFNSLSKDNEIFDIVFAGYHWTYVSFEFYDDKLCNILFINSYDEDENLITRFELLKEHLCDKYTIHKDDEDKYYCNWIDDYGFISLSKDFGKNGKGENKYWIKLYYSDSYLNNKLYESQKEEL